MQFGHVTAFCSFFLFNCACVGRHSDVLCHAKPTSIHISPKALQGEGTANFEFPLYTKSHDRVDVLLNATPRINSQGELVGVVGVGQDITEKKAAELQLVRSADDLRKLIDTVNVPIFGIDTQCCVNEWNQKAAEITGYTKEEVDPWSPPVAGACAPPPPPDRAREKWCRVQKVEERTKGKESLWLSEAPVSKIILQMHTPARTSQCWSRQTPAWTLHGVCIWMPLVNGTGNRLSPGQPTPGVVQQDKSSGGSVDTTKTCSYPQRVRMSSGERPEGAAKGKQPNSMASCPTPPPQALCDIHVAGCGEHLPAWGLRDDRIPGTLIRPSGEDAMGRSCILDSPPGRWMPAAVRGAAVVRMPACHSRRFKGERPIGAATG